MPIPDWVKREFGDARASLQQVLSVWCHAGFVGHSKCKRPECECKCHE